MASNPIKCCFALLLLVQSGCEQSIDRTAEIPAPVLQMVLVQPDLVQLEIAGAYSLRGLQGTLVYDPALLKIASVEPGKDVERLDRLFHSSLSTAAGSLVLGLTDTRQVMLPARGSLFRFRLQRVGAAGTQTTVSLDSPLGAIDGGERVRLEAARLALVVP